MNKQIELSLPPELAFDEEHFQASCAEQLHLTAEQAFRVIKRSIDARGKQVVVRLLGEIVHKGEELQKIDCKKPSIDVSKGRQVLIVGAGPAGLFAALRLLEAGIKPVILERGKDVQARRRDLAAINKDHVVNPHSNYCFGEGGAGTYSDGKLYTRSSKRGNIQRILQILVVHGAKEEILYDAHPHIGTNKLPVLIQEIRNTILACGGEIRFDTHVDGLVVSNDELKGVKTSAGHTFMAEACILATGHSARDIFEMLHRIKVRIEAKPFAIGVRVEHDQRLIDSVQYHCDGNRGDFLPAASYSLVAQTTSGGRERGVFSFCMCPGGFIVPSATAPGEVVVNGMSPSRRDSRFANSGIVVAVGLEDLAAYRQHGPLAGMYFQKMVEQKACTMAGGTQAAPAQRLVDFTNQKASSSLLKTSYQPGLAAADVGSLFPDFITDSLRMGLKAFGAKMKGYLTNEAQVVGVESRTSSPVRIPRHAETLEHEGLKRLFPCGEGAGYAGGIVSAAMDGERIAEAVISKYFK